ncbi:MAG: AI-2E family transporter, partial [Oscillospiraceae bacterium]|nr:AI-2E family transporter [Oscillospiraceae bacterium]
GALVLLMVNPQHALIFLVFCVAIQALDFYLIKPKLFSGCLGVSGLLILSAVVVLGNMFGVLGVLLSIPAAAVLSFAYNDYFMPSMEKRKQAREATEGETGQNTAFQEADHT